jgi:hypothetical protein
MGENRIIFYYFLIRKMYLLPLEGVRGEEPSLWEGLGRL